MAAETVVDSPHSSLLGVARVLVNAGKLTPKAASDLLRQSRERKTSFVAALIASGAMKSDELAHTLSSALALPLLDLAAVDLQRVPRNLVDAKISSQYQLVALGKRGNRLFIGAADPTDQEAVERIKFATQLTPEWIVVEYDKLARQLDAQGASTSQELESLAGGDFDFDVTEEDVGQPEAAEVAADVEDAPVVRFLQKMLIDAINMRASDLHFEPYEYHYRVRFRIDGELREITQPPLAIKDKLASRIKVISRMDIAEKRVPQDGRMKLKFGTRAIDFRVSTLPTLFGEKVVIRILDPSSA
ncbi:MAG: ATPase, T2SS/T4P/T4SS family, partial [Rubrivivax sp.]